MNRKAALIFIFASLLLSSCLAAPCTRQNNDRFSAGVKQIGYAFDAVEFNVAYSPEAKVEKLKQIRAQAQSLGAPACADYIKAMLLDSLDERMRAVGNPSNAPRPFTAAFEREFNAFQNASVAQLTDVANNPANSAIFLQIAIILIGLVIVVLIAFGGYLWLQSGHPQKS